MPEAQKLKPRQVQRKARWKYHGIGIQPIKHIIYSKLQGDLCREAKQGWRERVYSIRLGDLVLHIPQRGLERKHIIFEVITCMYLFEESVIRREK